MPHTFEMAEIIGVAVTAHQSIFMLYLNPPAGVLVRAVLVRKQIIDEALLPHGTVSRNNRD